MRLLYRPFGVLAGLIAARLGRSVFRTLWSQIDGGELPAATAPEGSIPKLVAAAALEGATMAGVAAAVSRVSAATFHYLFGIWPGERS